MPPWSMPTSTSAEPGRMPRSIARVISLGDICPGVSTPAMTRSASATVGRDRCGTRRAGTALCRARFLGSGKHRDLRADAVRDGKRVGADVARAEDHDFAGRRRRPARAAARRCRRSASAGTTRPPAPRAGRRWPTSAPGSAGRSAWPTVSKAMKVAPEASAASSSSGSGPKCWKPNTVWPRRGLAILGFLQLLDLDDQLAFPGIAERCAGLRGTRSSEKPTPAPAPGSTTTPWQASDSRRGQRDAVLAVLYFPRYADTHSPTRPGPR